jgi:hypothetical protein
VRVVGERGDGRRDGCRQGGVASEGLGPGRELGGGREAAVDDEVRDLEEFFFFFFRVSFFCFLQSPIIQNIVEKEITSYLLEARLGRQLLDGVPAVPQDALVAVDVRDLGAAGGGVDVAVFFF